MDTKSLGAFIKNFPDFPEIGIQFKDISPLLENPDAFAYTITALQHALKGEKFNKVVGIDARGFIFASALAHETKKGLIMSRKPGKLPGKLLSQTYSYEYSASEISIQEDRLRSTDSVVIIDDVLASGNTALAAYNIVAKKATVAAIACFIEIFPLGGRKHILQHTSLKNNQIISILQY